MCQTCATAVPIPNGRLLTNSQRTAVNAVYGRLFRNADKRDPSRTMALQNRYNKQMAKRFVKVGGLIDQTVDANNALRLPEEDAVANARAARSFKFRNDAERVAEFNEWLQKVINEAILQVEFADGRAPENGWQKVYVREAYGRGVQQATAAAQQAGVSIPVGLPDASSPESLASLFRLPIHQNTLELLYTRQFEDLRGVTREMSTQISRVLTEGLATGQNNRTIAKLMADRVEKIGLARSELIVRTEIIRVNSEATLNRLEELGATIVTPVVEFATASDPCSICEELNGRVYTIAEARGVIPVHPRCRCTWLPVLDKRRFETARARVRYNTEQRPFPC